MGIIEQIQKDIKTIVTDSSEFGVPITFIAPDGTTVIVNGLHQRHFIPIEQRENNYAQSYGSIGTRGNTVNAHVSFAEESLSELGYPVRINDNVNMKDHKVKAKDNTGLLRFYKVMEYYPDNITGLITLILSDYQE